MRRKVLVVLALMACLILQAVPVFATGGLDISSLPEPPEGTGLISFIDLVKSNGTYVYPDSDSNEVRLSNMLGLAKVIVYDKTSGAFLYTCDDGVNFEGAYYPCYVTKQTSDLQDAIVNSVVLDRTDRFDSLISGAYILFFDENASDISGIRYCVSSEDIINYYEPDKNSFESIGANKFVVTLLSKYPEVQSTSATYRLDYELNEGDEFWGNRREEKLSKIFVDTLNCIYVPTEERSRSGSIEFTVDRLRNGTYGIEIHTDMGNVYTASFEVDFAGVSSGLEDKFTGSYDAPVVSFDGLPAEGVINLTEPIYVTVTTDIPAQLIFDETVFGNYSLSNEVVLSRNGSYKYSVISEVGQVTEGVLNISCFDSNMAVSMSGLDLTMSGGSLVQTGVNDSNNYLVIPVIVIGLIGLVAGFIIYYKRRVKA